jgi:hypothetical protein
VILILNKKTILLYIAAILAIIIMLWYIGVQQIIHNLQTTNLLIFSVAALVQSFSLLMRGIRWRYILRTSDGNIGTLSSYSLIYVSWFANGLVPARIGDIVRAFAIKKEDNYPLGKGFASLVVERLLDVVVNIVYLLLFLALVANVLGLVSSSSWITVSLFLGVALGLALSFFIVLCIKKQDLVARILTRIVGAKYEGETKGFAKDLRASFGDFVSGKRLMLGIIFLSFVTWLIDVPKFYLVFLSLGLSPSVIAVAAAAFVTNAWAMVPITPGGIGSVEIGETFFVVFFVGLSLPVAVAIVLLDRIVTFYIPVLVGGILSVRKGISLSISSPTTGKKTR